MFHTLSFEAKRIYCNKRNFIIFLFFLFFSLYFVNIGIKKYNDFFVEKKNFLHYEKQKIKRYINYEQYGAYGFRVLFQPSPLVIFHSSAFLSLEGTIDTKEIVNISINYKGKSIFVNNGAFGDFSSMFYTFGSLLMLFFGLNFYYNLTQIRFYCRSRENLLKNIIRKNLAVIFLRMLLLDGYFSGVILTAYLTTNVKGIRFSGAETVSLACFSFFIILFINFFYFFGILCAIILSNKKHLFIAAYAVWFFLCFFIPEIDRVNLEQRANFIKSNETVNIKKLNNIMKFEKRYKTIMETFEEEKVKNLKSIFPTFLNDYLLNEYSLNKKIEDTLSAEVNKLIYYNKKKSVILPSAFFLFLSKESSGYGYANYQNFITYMMKLKERFSRYFFDKRYSKIGQNVKSFIQNDGNIFKPECALPENFLSGFWLTFFYSQLLFAVFLFFLKKRILTANTGKNKTIGEKIKIDISKIEKGKTLFSLCRDEKKRADILNFLQCRGAAVIEKLDLNSFEPGISLKSWIRYECLQRSINPDIVYAGLQKIGISQKKLKLRLKYQGAEALNRAYLEIKLCEKAQLYAFADFLKDVSKNFETDFKKRIKEIVNGTIFLYISSEMFEVIVKERKMPVEDNRFFIVDFDNISLR